MSFAAPFVSSVHKVEDQWIDYNGHFNMAYYNVIFDRAGDEAFLLLGLGPDYVKRTNCSFFTLEAHARATLAGKPDHLPLADSLRYADIHLPFTQADFSVLAQLRRSQGYRARCSAIGILDIDEDLGMMILSTRAKFPSATAAPPARSPE